MNFNEIIELFKSKFTYSTFHELKEPDEEAKIITINGTDKPLFWLMINDIEEKCKNFKYWISGSFKSTEPLYVLIRFVKKSILNNELQWQKLSGESYNEIIKFCEYMTLFNEVGKSINEKETKKRSSKKKID